MEVNSTLVKNRVHYSKLVLAKSKSFLCFNKSGNELSEDIFILPILNINFKYLYNYNKLYSMMNLDDLYNTIVLSDLYLDKKDNIIINENILTLIKSLDDSKYWYYPFNRFINLTNNFIKRGSDKGFEIKFLNNDKEKSDKSENNEYMFIEFDSKKFIDVKILKYNNLPVYKDFEKSKYTYDDINMLFDRLQPIQRRYLFVYLIISNKFTYLVLNNNYILEMMKEFMIMYLDLFKIVLNYGISSLYYHECFNKEKMKIDDPCIFDLYTVSNYFPVLPVDSRNPMDNPYLILPLLCTILIILFVYSV